MTNEVTTTGPASAPFGQIPHSTALAEAQIDSIQEVMGADPESQRFKAGLPRMIETLRKARVNWLAAEAQGRSKTSTKSGNPKALEAALKTIVQSADEAGF